MSDEGKFGLVSIWLGYNYGHQMSPEACCVFGRRSLGFGSKPGKCVYQGLQYGGAGTVRDN